jgi:hypothetical protein
MHCILLYPKTEHRKPDQHRWPLPRTGDPEPETQRGPGRD